MPQRDPDTSIRALAHIIHAATQLIVDMHVAREAVDSHWLIQQMRATLDYVAEEVRHGRT